MSKFNKKELVEIILNTISSEERQSSIIYWDEKPIEKGKMIKLGPKQIEMPFNGVMLFVDLEPKANWGHSAIYFLVNNNMQDIKVIKATFPPYLKNYPPSYRVILRYGKAPPHDRYFNVFNETS